MSVLQMADLNCFIMQTVFKRINHLPSYTDGLMTTTNYIMLQPLCGELQMIWDLMRLTATASKPEIISSK